MDRDEGQYFLPYIFDEILMKSTQLADQLATSKTLPEDSHQSHHCDD